jgi:hypothetical protein
VSSKGSEEDSSDEDGKETEEKSINYTSHFRKMEKNRTMNAQVHPLYTLEKKFDFLNRHTPINRVPVLIRDKQQNVITDPEELMMHKIRT